MDEHKTDHSLTDELERDSFGDLKKKKNFYSKVLV